MHTHPQTFSQIAADAKEVAKWSHYEGSRVAIAGTVAALAEAMERFERNTAEALSRISPVWKPQTTVDQWLEELRKEL